MVFYCCITIITANIYRDNAFTNIYYNVTTYTFHTHARDLSESHTTIDITTPPRIITTTYTSTTTIRLYPYGTSYSSESNA
ncbi:hypothetical protein DSUL_20417 [Desulfovibrionales bacterium]